MTRKRILVVDDMLSIRGVIAALLRGCGYEAVEAGSGNIALQLMRNHKFDLVLSDWNMPGLTGAEFVSAVRAEDSVTPVVMVTAEAHRERILEMKNIGVSGYLLKPFKQQALLEVVRKVLGEKPTSSNTSE